MSNPNDTENAGASGVARSDMLATLEQMVKDEGWGKDLIICYDKEDGFWLASIERGANGVHGSKDNEDCRRGTLAEAIKAAQDYEQEKAMRPPIRFIP